MNGTYEDTSQKQTGSKNFLIGLLTVLLLLGMGLEGCDAPAGPEGPEGPQGPVGPAGEDGSMIYAGEGEPAGDIGDTGDYYLNQNTGELYGPKDSDGWGDNPIIVLMGEDGKDGADGQDGEDGSQIHSGSGAPDAALGVVGDFYLDKDNYDLYGPKTDSGWGSPLNLKGADGNANVTRYIFPGHDFSADGDYVTLNIGLDENTFNESVWLAYMVNENGWKYSLPGPAYNSTYKFYFGYNTSGSEGRFVINYTEGTRENYDPIEIVQIESSETIDNRKQKGDSIIPDRLDTSNYKEVAEYYGFWQ